MFTQENECQNPIFNTLFCEDESLDEVLGCGIGFGEEREDLYVETHEKKECSLLETDLFWEDDELVFLLSKEKESHLCFNHNLDDSDSDSDGVLMLFRKDAVLWMLIVTSHYGFRPITAVLGVSYYDRFMSSVSLQSDDKPWLSQLSDKPWMNQLAAIACLSIAAKVEEIHVPLLLDLQVADAKFVFEAKTIQRMELLVLCTLGWKMNLVTPFSFFDHILRRFDLNTNLNKGVLKSFENVIMSIINDSMFLHYLPSVIAAATLMFVSKNFKPCELMQYQNQLMDVLKISKDKVQECYKLILELMKSHQNKQQSKNLKRKHQTVPGSPIGVIGAYFSCESSNDSWDVALSSVPSSSSSSSKALFKRNRVQDMANVMQ